MPLILRPLGDSVPLTEHLLGLGRSRRAARVTAGVTLFLATLLAGLCSLGILDSIFALPAWFRAVSLVLGLFGIRALYLRVVRSRVAESVNPLSIALLLEDRFPRLNDSLASAVEFLLGDQQEKPAVDSPRFRRIAVVRAENLARRHDLESIIPSGPAWRNSWLFLGLLLLTTVLALSYPSHAGTFVVRLVDPYGYHPYPPQTTLQVIQPEEFPTLTAKGSVFEIKAELAGVIPDTAQLQLKTRRNDRVVEEPISLLTDNLDPSTGRLPIAIRLEPARIQEDFAFRLIANDADTGWLDVRVAPPPTLVPWEGRPSPQFSLQYPAYTNLPDKQLPDGTSVIEAVSGTKIAMRAATDRPIAEAWIYPRYDTTNAELAEAVAALVSTNPFAAVGDLLLSGEALTPIPVRVTGERRDRLEAEFVPPMLGLYALSFTDDAGLTGTRLLDLGIFPDPVPVVTMTEPEPSGEPLMLLAGADLKVAARVEDRIYGARKVALQYQINSAGKVHPWRNVGLINMGRTGRYASALIGTTPGLIRPKPSNIETARTIKLADLFKPDGGGLIDGDIVKVRVAALDWDNINPLKGPGLSREIEIQIMSKSSLEALFQRELAGVRPELLRLREEQRAARSAVESAIEAAKNGPLPSETLGELSRAESVQRQLKVKVGDPTDGIRAKIERLRQTLQQNKLPRSAPAERLEGVADDLERLAEKYLQGAEPAVAEAKRASEESSQAELTLDTEPLERAAELQRGAEDAFDDALRKLEQWAGAGEVSGQARELRKQLDKLNQDIEKLTSQLPVGKSTEKLTPNERQQLEQQAGRLDQLARQADELVAKLGRMAEDKAQKADELAAKQSDTMDQAAQTDDPQKAMELQSAADELAEAAQQARSEAGALRQAAAEAGGLALPEDLRSAAETLRKNQPGRSAGHRLEAANRLDRLSDTLNERPLSTPEMLQKKRAQSMDAIDELARDQDELRKKTAEAQQLDDPIEQAEALARLAVEQEFLRRRAEQLVERLTRDRERKTADAVQQAANQMERSRDALDRGQTDSEPQEDSLERLDEALNRLEAEEDKQVEELAREQREQLEAQIRSLRERQAAALNEAERLQKAITEAKQWSRGELSSYADLDETEFLLAEELRSLIEKQLEELPVFARLAEQAARAMERASEQVARRVGDTDLIQPFDLELEQAADARVRKPMELAIRRLDQILEALKQSPNPDEDDTSDESERPEADQPEAPENQAAGQPQGVPAIAQLKALRAVQAEINERTAAFAKAHPDPSELTDDQREELRELEMTQKELAELVDQLTPLFRPQILEDSTGP